MALPWTVASEHGAVATAVPPGKTEGATTLRRERGEGVRTSPQIGARRSPPRGPSASSEENPDESSSAQRRRTHSSSTWGRGCRLTLGRDICSLHLGNRRALPMSNHETHRCDSDPPGRQHPPAHRLATPQDPHPNHPSTTGSCLMTSAGSAIQSLHNSNAWKSI